MIGRSALPATGPVGRSIRDALERADMNQRELAQAMGYSTKAVSRIIRGHVTLTVEAAVLMEMALQPHLDATVLMMRQIEVLIDEAREELN